MPTDDEKPPDGPREVTWRQALATAGIALSIPWTIAIPVYIGWQLDQRFGTWPILFIVSLVGGLGAGAMDIYVLLKRFGQFK
ncbi:MAG TPA: AtpZ/AtpI family protein [Blastocatellia bacterium]|nr:AtpZ/AtpI family protein [Blastocatellia bacterium]